MKQKEDALKKYGWDGIMPNEDTITMHSADLLNAMQDYANQFKITGTLPPICLEKQVLSDYIDWYKNTHGGVAMISEYWINQYLGTD